MYMHIKQMCVILTLPLATTVTSKVNHENLDERDININMNIDKAYILPPNIITTKVESYCIDDNTAYSDGEFIVSGGDNFQPSLLDCQKSCADHNECKFWTWGKRGTYSYGRCYLKRRRTSFDRKYPPFISGSKFCKVDNYNMELGDAANITLEKAIELDMLEYFIPKPNKTKEEVTVLDIIEHIIGESYKTKEESFNWLKKEFRGFNFVPLITNLIEQFYNTDLQEMIKIIHMQKMYEAISPKEIDTRFVKAYLNKTTELFGVQGIDVSKIMEGLNFDKINAEINNGGANLTESLNRIDIKKIVAGINVKEFSRNLGKTITDIMEKIDSTGPYVNIVKGLKLLRKIFPVSNVKKSLQAIDVKKMLKGININPLALIFGVDFIKILEIVKEFVNLIKR